MPENWAEAASDVLSAISDVGFDVTLEMAGAKSGPDWRPVVAAPTVVTVKVLEFREIQRDAVGTLVGRSVRTLMVPSLPTAPRKGDRVQVQGTWFEIDAVHVQAPGGVALYYKLMLKE